ncbi:MAG: DUF1540 domain-containing protein [Chitinivibrionales bacterium]|nr:DUF1540 domain-containing protein [Chitinivibrionales bacterium]MBD3358179.1 DUF1540 domain-containing protein [Chitinivibrionales bacterium]
MEKEMSQITECEAMQCLYNRDGKCHTFGITVGGNEPCCDTFMQGDQKGGLASILGGVAACHIADCRYNSDYECGADGIRVSMSGSHPDCVTFSHK